MYFLLVKTNNSICITPLYLSPSAGVNAARDAILTFMVGGPEAAFPKAEAILANMGKNVVHCGAVGTGQVWPGVQRSGYPLHRENRENGPKNSLSGKTLEIWKFCQNTGKTQGIWFAQVVNSLTLMVKDISIFAVKISIFFKTDKSAKSVLCMK